MAACKERQPVKMMPALQSMQPSTQATALPALLLVLALLPSTALAILTDAELLLDFWDTFPNAPAVLPDWNQSAEGAPCVWAGVSCSPEGRVTHISLEGVQLGGSIPEGGWALPATLEWLDLARNDLQGKLATDWVLPPKLQGLYLASNFLTGTLDPDWRLPETLQVLDLYNNSINGSIPAAWPLPPALQVLNLASNALSGPLPEGWALPPQLFQLSIANNSLNGTLPSALAFPATLTLINLANNTISGRLPDTWVLPSGLKNMYFSANRLTGTLPPWTFPPDTYWVEVEENLLTGPIPASWVQPANVILYNNALSGPLPSLDSFTNSGVVVLPGNAQLCGAVPAFPQYYSQGGASGSPCCLTQEPSAPQYTAQNQTSNWDLLPLEPGALPACA